MPEIYKDERGYFFELYNKNTFCSFGITDEFVQDNQSLSAKNVLRGLHFQNPPFAQAKLVSVTQGKALDVAVDIRKNSSTYGKHFSILLSSEVKNMLYIPKGFAHGFLTLENDTIFSYKCSQVYNKEAEETLLWCDETLAIDWGKVKNPAVSIKDQQAKRFSDFVSRFD